MQSVGSILSAMLAIVSTAALAQAPQISEGVRARLVNRGEVPPRKDGPLPWRKGAYLVIAHPPVSTLLQQKEIRYFKDSAELLAFFTALPIDVQAKGLWLGPLGYGRLTPDEKEHLATLTTEARAKKILLYTCDGAPVPPDRSNTWLTGWECRMASPTRLAEYIYCVPKALSEQTKTPLWDCSFGEAPRTHFTRILNED